MYYGKNAMVGTTSYRIIIKVVKKLDHIVLK